MPRGGVLLWKKPRHWEKLLLSSPRTSPPNQAARRSRPAVERRSIFSRIIRYQRAAAWVEGNRCCGRRNVCILLYMRRTAAHVGGFYPNFPCYMVRQLSWKPWLHIPSFHLSAEVETIFSSALSCFGGSEETAEHLTCMAVSGEKVAALPRSRLLTLQQTHITCAGRRRS